MEKARPCRGNAIAIRIPSQHPGTGGRLTPKRWEDVKFAATPPAAEAVGSGKQP